MSNLISKSALLAEIERLVNNYDKALDYEAALEDVRDFIDSLEVKELAENERDKGMCKENGNSLTQEPANEDLEKAAVEAFKQIVDSDKNNFLEIFKAGAKWQKEQMMAKAVDGEVTYGRSLAIPSLGWVLDKERLDYGDKVKLIIIKED